MKYHLFEVYGIELEYMLVTKKLTVNPIADQLFQAKTGTITSDVANGKIEWSNELVAHVVELKTAFPTSEIENLDNLFSENITEINQLLKVFDSRLLPTAAHPLMNPLSETKLWPHNYNEIYALYNNIFDCTGHGWSNVQSMHINLPFANDVEFEKLHAAIRILLPIIPALSASSPIFEGRTTGFLDSRMEAYKTNQKEIPQMAGKIIPEAVFSKTAYCNGIFEPIKQAIKPYDKKGILQHHFLNSRGAIARFDRNAIEIRVIDLQECPKADLAIAILIIETLKILVNEVFIPLEEQKRWKEDDLFQIFNEIIKKGEKTSIKNTEYLAIFNFQAATTANSIWKKIYKKVKQTIPEKHQKTIEILLNSGSLSTRILKALGKDFSEKNIKKIYSELADCLQKNEIFIP